MVASLAGRRRRLPPTGAPVPLPPQIDMLEDCLAFLKELVTIEVEAWMMRAVAFYYYHDAHRSSIDRKHSGAEFWW